MEFVYGIKFREEGSIIALSKFSVMLRGKAGNDRSLSV